MTASNSMEKVYRNLNVEQMIYFNKLWVCLIIENNAVKHLIHLFCLFFALIRNYYIYDN